MSTEENKAIVRRFYEGYLLGRDTSVGEELLAPSFHLRAAGVGWRSLQPPGPGTLTRAMKVWWDAFPDLAAPIEQMVAEGDKVLVVSMMSGTQQADFIAGPAGPIKATGRRFTLPDMSVYRVSDGKIVEGWGSFNAGSLWQQLGAIPTPGQVTT